MIEDINHVGDQFYRPPISMENGILSQRSRATITPLQQVDGMIMSGSIRLKGSLGLSIGPDSQSVHNGPPYEATTTPLQQVDAMIMSGSIRQAGSPGFSIGPDSQPVHNGPPFEETTTPLQQVDGMIMSRSIRRDGNPGFSIPPYEATTTPLQQVDGMIMSRSIRREGGPGFSIGQGSRPVHNGLPFEATTTPLQQVDGMIMSRSIRREGGPGFSIGQGSRPVHNGPPFEETTSPLQQVDGMIMSRSIRREGPYADALKLNPEALVDGIHPLPDIVAGTDKYISNIDPTMAEAEAIARGLQTIKYDDLEEIRELGSGTYGAVCHAKWKGSDVAIKRIKASFTGIPSERARLIANFWKEATVLSPLHHPNVVSFYGVVPDGSDGSLATVTELMDGSLKQILHKKDRTIDRRKRLIIAMDVAFGMEYLHGKNIVHFDLKCDNILVNMRDPQRPVCKIGDLGLSKAKQLTLVSGGVRGTLPWMAPELLSGKSNMVSEKVDVYSFGIVMWELLTGDEPYADIHYASIIGGIVNSTLRPQIPTWCDPKWKSLMESCWASDPIERPSFSEISKKLRGCI